MESMARSAATFMTWPCRAQGPDMGAIRPTSMSFFCAAAPNAAKDSATVTAAPIAFRTVSLMFSPLPFSF
jgi:hypothetical protein